MFIAFSGLVIHSMQILFLHFGLAADIGTDTVNLVECYNYSNFRVHADYPQVA